MKYINIFLSTALTVFAFMFNQLYDAKPLYIQLTSNDGDFVGATWSALTLFIFVFYWQSWKRHKDLKKIEAVFSVIFSALMLIGRSFFVYNSMHMISAQKCMVLFAGLGWSIFFYMLLRWIVYFVDNQYLMPESRNKQKLFQITIIVFILLCWLPHFFLSFPGNVPYDGVYQLCQWFGYYKPIDNHPWFTTALFGILMSIGKSINDNIGIVVIIIFQFIVCSWAYSYVCLTVGRYAGKKAAYFAALFFAVVPILGSYAATVSKDTLFSAAFALYFCKFIDIFENEKTDKKGWLVFWLLSLLICLIRHDGIYRVILAGISMFLLLKRARRQLLLVLAGVCICIFMYNIVIFDIIGVSKGSVGEMLSIPFQQTARYSLARGSRDLSNEEKEAINRILPYDKLPKLYNPRISDPVKSTMKSSNNEDLKRYLYAWAKIGIRHPGIYLQATINNTYGYYYPFFVYGELAGYPTYIKGKPVNKGLDIYYTGNKKAREALHNYDKLWRIIPGLSLLTAPGAYTWIVLIGIMLILKKKQYKKLVVFSALITQILICIASPSNGVLRYAMPLMVCTPTLLAWLRWTLCSSKNNEA